MDAARWQGCNDLDKMLFALSLAFVRREEWVPAGEKKRYAQLEPLRRGVSLRKMRLVLCACARKFWDRMTSDLSRRAVELCEQAADRQVAATALTAHLRKVQNVPARQRSRRKAADQLAVYCVVRLGSRADWPYVLRSATQTLMYALAGEEAGLIPAQWQVWEEKPGSKQALAEPSRVVCELLREVLGNPFREVPFPRRWPATVQGLARSLYEGEDCRLPLHDALLDADQPDLAEHFQAAWHPRGCWALDRLLGKK